MELTIRYRVASIMKLHGFGSSVIQRLVKTSIKRNLYYEIKEKVVEERFDGNRVNKNKALVKVYGLDSTKDVRARLIELLYDRVAYHKDKFVAQILHDEMQAMVVKPSGKVEHSEKTHDDQVFSYLMALYVWYDGKNIMENFNIQKNTIHTDEDEEIVSGDIEENEGVERVSLDLSNANDGDDAKDKLAEELEESLNFIKEANDKAVSVSRFMATIYENEIEQLDAFINTDPLMKKTYQEKYNIADDGKQTRTMITIPDSEFFDDDIYSEEQNKHFNGNMHNMFINL